MSQVEGPRLRIGLIFVSVGFGAMVTAASARAGTAVPTAESPCVAGADFYHRQDTMSGHPQVAFESVALPGGNAPGTPADLNQGIFLRARSVACAPWFPPQLDALVIAMPGFAGSATQWGEFAAQLVEKAQQSTCHLSTAKRGQAQDRPC